MAVSVLAEAVELTTQRVPYVLATVVWRRGPSSGRQGSKAVVLADGTVRGWLGGACAEPSVVRHARECLETGQPALLFVGQNAINGGDGIPFGDDGVVDIDREFAGHVELPAQLADIGHAQGQRVAVADLDVLRGGEGKRLVGQVGGGHPGQQFA